MAAIENGRIVRARRWLFALIGGLLVWFAFCADTPHDADETCECE